MPIPTPVRRRALILAAIALASPIAAVARGSQAPIRITHAWSRPTPPGANGAGYLTITNTGRTPDTLISVVSPAAARVTLHSTRMRGGVMSMRPLTSLAIPAAGTLALSPGGYHLMLEGLKRPLKIGDRVPATLTFARSGKVAIQFTVQAGPDPMAGMKM
jgi:copper(I)-binding protein